MYRLEAFNWRMTLESLVFILQILLNYYIILYMLCCTILKFERNTKAINSIQFDNIHIYSSIMYRR